MVAQPVVVERLALDDVEARGGELARIEGLEQRGLVDDRPARRVDQDRARPHPRERPGVDQVAGRRVEVAVQADEVALLEQLFEPVDAADAQRLVDPLAEIRVVEDDVEPERLGAQGRRGADPAAADHAERLAAQPGVPMAVR